MTRADLLAPLPMTAAEIADLVERTRRSMIRARAMTGAFDRELSAVVMYARGLAARVAARYAFLTMTAVTDAIMVISAITKIDIKVRVTRRYHAIYYPYYMRGVLAAKWVETHDGATAAEAARRFNLTRQAVSRQLRHRRGP